MSSSQPEIQSSSGRKCHLFFCFSVFTANCPLFLFCFYVFYLLLLYLIFFFPLSTFYLLLTTFHCSFSFPRLRPMGLWIERHWTIHSSCRFWIRESRKKSSLALARCEASLRISGFTANCPLFLFCFYVFYLLLLYLIFFFPLSTFYLLLTTFHCSCFTVLPVCCILRLNSRALWVSYLFVFHRQAI